MGSRLPPVTAQAANYATRMPAHYRAVGCSRITTGVENERLELRMRKGADERLLALASDPQGLLLLRRYCTKIENAVSRKVRELRRA